MEFGKRKKGAEINVTPLVDVMLVLLVIFMVATPMMQNEVEVNLPKIKSASKLEAKKESVKIAILKDKLFFNGREIKKDELKTQLDKYAVELIVYIKADKDLRYKQIAEILDILKEKGFSRIALVSYQD